MLCFGIVGDARLLHRRQDAGRDFAVTPPERHDGGRAAMAAPAGRRRSGQAQPWM
jgi:hypothetical protein